MKNNKAIKFLKHLISVLSSKSTAIKSKTEAIRARLMVLSLLKSKKLSLPSLGTKSISHKIHALLGQKEEERSHDHDDEDEVNKAIVLYNNAPTTSIEDYSHSHYQDSNEILLLSNSEYNDDYDDKYPDLTHSLFAEEDDYLGDPNASAIDMVRNSKAEEGQSFVLEDEIDNVADLFIKKFHKRMKLQKLESFKRYQEMLLRST